MAEEYINSNNLLDQHNLPKFITTSSDKQKSISKTKSTVCKKFIQSKILVKDQVQLGYSDDNETINLKQKDNTYQKRLQQNRQSAKKSRLKKKQYLSQLEQTAKSVTQQFDKVNNQLVDAKKNLQKYIQNNTVDGFNIGRKQTYDRLSQLIQDSNHYDEDQINLLLDTLKHRVGATGKQRQSTLNYYFKKLIDVCLPSLHRYLMWTAYQKIEFFNQDDSISSVKWTKQLMNTVKLTNQKKQNLLKLQKRLVQKKQRIEQSIENFKVQKQKLQNESGRIQNTIQEMRKCLTPIQSSKCILFIENYKYKRQMNLWIQNNHKDQQKDYEESPIRKKIKKN